MMEKLGYRVEIETDSKEALNLIKSVLGMGIRRYIEKPLNQKVFARIIREVLDEPGRNTRDYF